MANAPWNVLDSRGIRIACCNREDFKKDSDAEDEANALLMAEAPTLDKLLQEEIWRTNHLCHAIKQVVSKSRPEWLKTDEMVVEYLKQALREVGEPER